MVVISRSIIGIRHIMYRWKDLKVFFYYRKPWINAIFLANVMAKRINMYKISAQANFKRSSFRVRLARLGIKYIIWKLLKASFKLALMWFSNQKVWPIDRGVHSGDRVGFGRVSFSSVVFQIGYFSVACYGGSARLVTVQLCWHS